jgi:hypothetical protein
LEDTEDEECGGFVLALANAVVTLSRAGLSFIRYLFYSVGSKEYVRLVKRNLEKLRQRTKPTLPMKRILLSLLRF